MGQKHLSVVKLSLYSDALIAENKINFILRYRSHDSGFLLCTMNVLSADSLTDVFSFLLDYSAAGTAVS